MARNLIKNYFTEMRYRILVWRKLYDSGAIFLHAFSCCQVWCMVHQLLQEQDSELFNNFRSAQASECAAVAVAGTITATIAITSMSLPSVTEVHWIVRALWLFSLLSGLIAVLYACNQQMTIARNVCWQNLWDWLNDADASAKFLSCGCRSAMWPSRSGENRHQQEKHGVQPDKSERKECQGFLVPDIFAVILLSAPRKLIHYSLDAYLVGIAAYLGLAWKKAAADDANDDDRNIFIVFMCAFGICYVVYCLSSVANRCKGTPYQNDWELLKGLEKKEISSRELGKSARADCRRCS